jgi:basic membrane lipoprotein Med (substrate-binding protein (PBP1-ABC) superfamily)
MTYRSPHIKRPWIAIPVLVLLVLAAAGYVFEADSRTGQPTRVLVVVDTAGRQDPHLVERATAAFRQAERAGAEADLRVTRTPTEQLSVTHYFAAKRYDAIVGVNLDSEIAVEPVEQEYPETRFALADEAGLSAAVAAAAR